MNTRNLGNARVSALGLDCKGMSGFYGGRGDAKSVRTIWHALPGGDAEQPLALSGPVNTPQRGKSPVPVMRTRRCPAGNIGSKPCSCGLLRARLAAAGGAEVRHICTLVAALLLLGGCQAWARGTAAINVHPKQVMSAQVAIPDGIPLVPGSIVGNKYRVDGCLGQCRQQRHRSRHWRNPPDDSLGRYRWHERCRRPDDRPDIPLRPG